MAMKQLIEDTLKVGASVQELLLSTTARGKLQTQVRLNRPNWSVSQCFRASRWLARNGLKPAGSFTSAEDYRSHLMGLLSEYARHAAVVSEHEVADELSLSRWEARWQRARLKQQEQQNIPSKTAAKEQNAA
jgi:hypothetical protein